VPVAEEVIVARKAKIVPKAKPIADDEVFMLEYNVYGLPSAQHKAGLAGLVLQIRAMESKNAPVIEQIGPHSVTIAFTRQSLVDLFDDLYDVAIVEVEVDKPWKDSAKNIVRPKRTIVKIVDVDGKRKEIKKLIYNVNEPKSSLMARRVGDNHPLLKLFRDQIKSVVRTVDMARKVYKDRAKTGKSDVGEKIWESITEGRIEKISGSLRLGVEGTTAERAEFREDARLSLLLHFWPVVSLPYIPNTFKVKGKQLEYRYGGIATSVPEVAELETFCDVFPRLLDDLASDEALAGYRPRNMVIDCPEQAGLDLSSRVCALAAGKASLTEIGYCLSGVEIWWTEKVDKTVRIHMVRRVDGRPELARKYDLIKNSYRNRLFRSIAITALVKGTSVADEAGRFYRTLPHEVMLDKWFGSDVRRYIDGVKRQNKELQEMNLTIEETDRLSEIVHRLVNQYVRQKVKSKTGDDPFDKKFQKDVDGRQKRVPRKEVLEAWIKVCQQTHLDVRSRNADDFLAYFTGQICTDSQYIPNEDRTTLSRHLFTGDWETVKNMVNLSLSALSGRFGAA
jgi:CRISPR-associated protein Cmx8